MSKTWDVIAQILTNIISNIFIHVPKLIQFHFILPAGSIPYCLQYGLAGVRGQTKMNVVGFQIYYFSLFN